MLHVWLIPLLLSLCVYQEFVHFFRETMDRKVCWGDRMEFINGWYILLIISDVFTITGSIIKIGIESKVWPAYQQHNNVIVKLCCLYPLSMLASLLSEYVLIWLVWHPVGNLHTLGVGWSNSLPHILPEVQCKSQTHCCASTDNVVSSCWFNNLSKGENMFHLNGLM